jgi:hypothetical protein
VQYGCLVVNAPTANTVAAAEHGIALMCALARNIAQADASMKAGRWERNKYVGASLVDKTLAIMGFGKVRSGCLWRKGLQQPTWVQHSVICGVHGSAFTLMCFKDVLCFVYFCCYFLSYACSSAFVPLSLEPI